MNGDGLQMMFLFLGLGGMFGLGALGAGLGEYFGNKKPPTPTK